MGMIVGFNFTKLVAEKKTLIKGKVNVNNNVSLKNVESEDLSLGKQKQNALKFTFEFTSKYEPDIGNIIFQGEILFIDEAKIVKDTLASWKKDKKVPKDIMMMLLNTVLAKCNIQALILSHEINLPPPIPMPRVQIGGEESNKERQHVG